MNKVYSIIEYIEKSGSMLLPSEVAWWLPSFKSELMKIIRAKRKFDVAKLLG